MFKFMRALALTLSVALVTTAMTCDKDDGATPTEAVDITAEQKAIQQLLDAYGDALNASDAAKITALFAQDAVFAAPGSPTATGPTQIRGAFDGLFGAVDLDLQFTPAEIVVANANYAYATSTSSGTVLVKANGQSSRSSYRELWAFTKENGQWKIARYLFNQPQ